MSSGGGKGGDQGSTYVPGPATTQTQTTTTDPWGGLQPYLTDIYKQAQTAYGTPLSYFPGQTYASFSPETEKSMEMIKSQALAGSPVAAGATGEAAKTLGGSYLEAGNPYFSNMVSNLQKTLEPAIGGKFASSGRYGSGAKDVALASAMTDEAGKLAYQNYADERANMMKALMMAPQTAQLGTFDASQLAQVGATKEDQTQRGINEAMARQQFGQMEPWQRLSMYANIIAGMGMPGGTSTTTGTGTQLIPREAYGDNTFGDVMGGVTGLGGLGMLAYSLFA